MYTESYVGLCIVSAEQSPKALCIPTNMHAWAVRLSWLEMPIHAH